MRDQLTDRAAAIATSHGTAAASWVFDGNTSDETYDRVLRGTEEGDPGVLDAYRVPDLSGEYGSDYTEQDLADELGLDAASGTYADDLDSAATAYLDAAGLAFWHEVERVARDHFLGIHPEHDGPGVRWTVHYPAIVAEISGRLCAQHI